MNRSKSVDNIKIYKKNNFSKHENITNILTVCNCLFQFMSSYLNEKYNCGFVYGSFAKYFYESILLNDEKNEKYYEKNINICLFKYSSNLEKCKNILIKKIYELYKLLENNLTFGKMKLLKFDIIDVEKNNFVTIQNNNIDYDNLQMLFIMEDREQKIYNFNIMLHENIYNGLIDFDHSLNNFKINLFDLEKMLGIVNKETKINEELLDLNIYFQKHARNLEIIAKIHPIIIKNKYKIVGKTFDLIYEKNENCEITNIKPPFTKIKLTCGHYISIMAYIGKMLDILNFNICCFCRQKAEPTITIVESKTYNIPNIISKNNDLQQQVIDNECELEYICGIINKIIS